MRALALIVLVLALTGCRTRKKVVLHKHTPRGSVTVIKVKRGPPARVHVVVVKPRRPGPKYVWVKGHHVYRSRRYTWVKARWVVPPSRMHVWVHGHHRRGEWAPGHWR